MNTQQQINPSGNLGEWPIKVTGPLDFNEFRKAHQRIKAVYLRRIGIIGGPVLGGLLFWSYISDGLATTLSSIFGLAAGFAVILVSSRFTVRSVFKSCPPVTQWQIHNNRIEKICGTTAKTQAMRTIHFRQVTGYTASAGSLAVLLETGELEVIPRSGFQTQTLYDQVKERLLSIDLKRNYRSTAHLESSTSSEQLEFSGSYNKDESQYFLDAIGRATGKSIRKTLARLPLCLGAFSFVLSFGAVAIHQLKQFGRLNFDLLLRWDLWAISVIGPLVIYSMLRFFVMQRLRSPQTWKLSRTTNSIEISGAGRLTTREINHTVDLTISPEGILSVSYTHLTLPTKA